MVKNIKSLSICILLLLSLQGGLWSSGPDSLGAEPPLDPGPNSQALGLQNSFPKSIPALSEPGRLYKYGEDGGMAGGILL